MNSKRPSAARGSHVDMVDDESFCRMLKATPPLSRRHPVCNLLIKEMISPSEYTFTIPAQFMRHSLRCRRPEMAQETEALGLSVGRLQPIMSNMMKQSQGAGNLIAGLDQYVYGMEAACGMVFCLLTSGR